MDKGTKVVRFVSGSLLSLFFFFLFFRCRCACIHACTTVDTCVPTGRSTAIFVHSLIFVCDSAHSANAGISLHRTLFGKSFRNEHYMLERMLVCVCIVCKLFRYRRYSFSLFLQCLRFPSMPAFVLEKSNYYISRARLTHPHTNTHVSWTFDRCSCQCVRLVSCMLLHVAHATFRLYTSLIWIRVYTIYTWRTGTVITGVHGTMNAIVFASCKGVQYTDKSNEKRWYFAKYRQAHDIWHGVARTTHSPIAIQLFEFWMRRGNGCDCVSSFVYMRIRDELVLWLMTDVHQTRPTCTHRRMILYSNDRIGRCYLSVAQGALVSLMKMVR